MTLFQLLQDLAYLLREADSPRVGNYRKELLRAAELSKQFGDGTELACVLEYEGHDSLAQLLVLEKA